jgi:DNA-binding MarR family transcriptional regulator
LTTNVNGADEPHIATLLGLAFRRLHRELSGGAEGREQLRASHRRLLTLIPPEGERITDLAARAGMTKQGIGQHVQYLRARGLVAVESSPSDKRTRVVRRTEKGDAVSAAALRTICALEERWRSELGSRRYAALRATLRDMAAHTEPAGRS